MGGAARPGFCMSAPAIQFEGVSKSYGKVEAVRGLSLAVPAGSVYGFLGPNGAGKTTSIRLALGLQRADQGRVALFGLPMESCRAQALRRLGSLVDSPSLYPHLTGRENLEIPRRILGLRPAAVDDALETVRLTAVAGRAVKTYSMGMRQRLGIAQALLGGPELLVLDEPTNGLDPAGIQEVREMLRALPATRGVTVFLSSHLLAEVEQVATHVAILARGEVRYEGTPEGLRGRGSPVLEVDVDDPARARELLERTGFVVETDGPRLTLDGAAQPEPARVNALLVGAGLAVSHLCWRRASLEDLFLELTREREAA